MADLTLSPPVEVEGKRWTPPLARPAPDSPGARPLYQGIQAAGDEWMRLACDLATQSVGDGGGPFGALLLQVDDESGRILRYWRGHNQVTAAKDSTAHAEILALRSACASLGVFDLGAIRRDQSQLPQPGLLSHGVLYSSAEPCPMCYAAIAWARLPTFLFAATRFDAAAAGFSDQAIYDELARPYAQRDRQVFQGPVENALEAFELWKRSDKTLY